MIAPLMEEQSGFEPLDEGVDESISLIGPNLIIKLINIDKSELISSPTLLNKRSTMSPVLLP